MKQTILVVLTVLMFATPCLAQEIEPDGIFSIDGTYWEGESFFIRAPEPQPYPLTLAVGFAGGEVYSLFYKDVRPSATSFYADLLVASIFMYKYNGEGEDQSITMERAFGIILPAAGIGIMHWEFTLHTPSVLAMLLLSKTEDNWTPPSE